MELFPLFLKLEGRDVPGRGRGPCSRIEDRKPGPQRREGARGRSGGHRSGPRSGPDQARSFGSNAATSPAISPALSSWSPRRPLPNCTRKSFEQARRAGVLCNAVDEPDRCDFYYPAVVRRGPLQIAISTGGLFPALAQRLRQNLELQFGPEYGAVGRGNRPQPARNCSLQNLAPTNATNDCGTSPANPPSSNSSATDQRRPFPCTRTARRGKVYFVGAGPGDPELLTRKAFRFLSSAEVVLHDALVAPELLLSCRQPTR